MRKIYLVRHTTPDFKEGEKLCIGHTDIDIGIKGVEEAKRLREYFRGKDIKKIYTSPLSRCKNTAKIISDDKIPVCEDERLIEIFMGEWEARPLKDIKKNLGDEPQFGEKRVDALKRMSLAMEDMMKSTEGDIICVSHAGISCAFIAKSTGRDIKTSRGIKIPYGSYTVFEYEGNFNCLEIGVIP